MSMRIIRWRSRYRNSASDLAISVLPTPVGPMNRSEASGRSGRASAALTVASRSTIASTACTWPITRRLNQSRLAARSKGTVSSSSSSGRPVSRENAAVTSAAVSGEDPGFASGPGASANRFFKNRSGRPGQAEYVA
jgi:hypothetical protein